MIKIIRACTVPQTLEFVEGMIPELAEKYEVVLLSSPGEYWVKLEEKGLPYRGVQVPMERHISPIKDFKALLKLVKVFKKEKPTIVHSMTPKAGLLCMLIARWFNVPVRIHSFTGLYFPTATGIKKRIVMLTDKITCACATHVIPEGEGVKRDLLNNGITKKDINVLGYGNCRGIDLERFDRMDEVLDVAKNIENPWAFTFIAIGRLVGDKGINELVEAFVRLNNENPKTRLILVGGAEANLDPLKPETIVELNKNAAIVAPGKQSDVRPWLAASDCHVLASYREGFPNVVIEAGAMGLPQIVTDINGANEIIIEGKNGTIIPSKNADALYHAMKKMMEDKEWRESLAKNAREMIASRFDQHYVRKCLYDFYDEILSKFE